MEATDCVNAASEGSWRACSFAENSRPATSLSLARMASIVDCGMSVAVRTRDTRWLSTELTTVNPYRMQMALTDAFACARSMRSAARAGRAPAATQRIAAIRTRSRCRMLPLVFCCRRASARFQRKLDLFAGLDADVQLQLGVRFVVE